jgi:hypothetical protein
MLVLDRSRALESMLWLSQRARIAVPPVLQRPSFPVALVADGRRMLASEFVLGPHARRTAAPIVAPVVEPAAAPTLEAVAA